MSLARQFGGVASRSELRRVGVDADRVAREVRAGRWCTYGSAVLLHNAPPTTGQRTRAVLINCGPRAVLTSFTALAAWGVHGWERDEVHVLAPAGTRRPQIRGLVLHRAADWSAADLATGRRLHRAASAAVLAAAGCASPRPACAVVAACVQQRVATVADLRNALSLATRARHRGAVMLAVDDIEQGAQALSEIDFVRLCRRAGLPTPALQRVRTDRLGRRRYLDAEWDLDDGRRLAVEVDGALHLTARTWYADQLRQNEVVLDGTTVLRFPSALVRHEPQVVIAQLRRALAPRR